MVLFSFKNLRILILLILLAFTAIYTQDQRLNTRYWYQPTTVAIFPINGDGSEVTANYIKHLTPAHFQDIDAFFTKNAKQYKLITPTPIMTTLGPSIASQPPSPPKDRNAMLSVMLWSLKLRYWAYMNTPDDISNNQRIRLYVLFHQAKAQHALEHSLGLQKGLIGIIHAYADRQQNQQNQIVMAHEILHTVGAIDKYDQHNQPIFPEGYAKPLQKPLHPQRFAEIMAGRAALSERSAEIPKNLRHVVVGEMTAKEINWLNE
tara:strand:- start:780 stop:1565 length:786 start_codon:yes stop_codon:yes gene_type:complete